MSKKIERELQGPGWTEVIFSAVLSLLLGVVLAAVCLVFKPVVVAKELPKDRAPDTVYYVAGSHDSSKARQASAKEKAFLQGGSVVVNEDELNTILAPAAPGGKAAAPAPTGVLTPGALNARIRDNVLQLAVPLHVSVAGFDQDLIAQARGGFEKNGDMFVFAPSEVYVGSCPVQRIPGLSAMLLKRVYAATPVPPEVVAAWQKLADVAVEGTTLRLSMP